MVCKLLSAAMMNPPELSNDPATATPRGGLDLRTEHLVRLRIAELVGHEALIRQVTADATRAGIDGSEVEGARNGSAASARDRVCLMLGAKLAREQGRHARFLVDTARGLGLSPSELESIARITGAVLIAGFHASLGLEWESSLRVSTDH